MQWWVGLEHLEKIQNHIERNQMCANRVHLEKREMQWGGGTYEELLYFLKTRELPKLITYFSNCSQDTKDTAVALFKNEHDPSTLDAE